MRFFRRVKSLFAMNIHQIREAASLPKLFYHMLSGIGPDCFVLDFGGHTYFGYHRSPFFVPDRIITRRCLDMAKAGARVKITLRCSECKQRNYNTMKNKKNTPDRLKLNKYCPFCRKHTVHDETK